MPLSNVENEMMILKEFTLIFFNEWLKNALLNI